MTDAQILKDLLERVEKAEGPDRLLDAETWRLLNGLTVYDCLTPRGEILTSIPALTASLDAAIALVERLLPGWMICVSDLPPNNPAGAAVTALRDDPKVGDDVLGYGRSRALSAVAALLKVLIAQPQDSATLQHEQDHG